MPNLLDFLFPKQCVGCRKFGSYVCAECFSRVSFFETGICVVCQRQSIDCRTHAYCRTKSGLDGVFSSLIYNGVVKRLIYQFKYKPYVADLRDFMVDLFYEGLIQKDIFYDVFGPEVVLVPIPLHTSRMRSRGYNQAQLLAEGLSRRFNTQVLFCLERIKKTTTQFRLSKIQREENIKGAFTVKSEFSSKLPQSVFLVDDIVTSGSTLKEGAKVLKKAGVENVWGLTLAHGK